MTRSTNEIRSDLATNVGIFAFALIIAVLLLVLIIVSASNPDVASVITWFVVALVVACYNLAGIIKHRAEHQEALTEKRDNTADLR